MSIYETAHNTVMIRVKSGEIRRLEESGGITPEIRNMVNLAIYTDLQGHQTNIDERALQWRQKWLMKQSSFLPELDNSLRLIKEAEQARCTASTNH